MSIFSAILYGIIQGLTEFLPVSSSGHLALAGSLFNVKDIETSHFTFSILLHLATLVAVLIIYRNDIFSLIPAFFRVVGKLFRGKFRLSEYDGSERMVIFVIIATLPLIPIAFFNEYLEAVSSYVKVVGGILIFNGILLFLSDMIKKGEKEITDIKPRNAIAVGLCQMLAVLPGLSRSGSTITGGRLCGFTREFAVKFSFILSIPAIIGANIMEIPELVNNPIEKGNFLPYICGMLAALVSGIIAMKLIIYIAKKSKFRIFSYYCIIVGIIAVIFG